MEKTLKLSARVTIPDSLLFREIEGEAVILDPRDGQYYGMDEVGTRIFQLMGDHPSLTPVFEQLLAEFEVDGPSLERDLLRFADQLAAHNLVELAGG